MFILRDFEVKKEIYRDDIRWAEQERLFREIIQTTKMQKVPLYGQLLSWIGQQLINSGEFLQRQHSNAAPVI